MLHAVVVGYDHHEIHGLATELQAPAATGDRDGCGSAPHAACSPARSDAFTVTSAEAHRDFYQRGNHSDALRIAHHLVGNGFVGGGHDFVQIFGGGVETFDDIRLVFVVIRRPGHGGTE